MSEAQDPPPGQSPQVEAEVPTAAPPPPHPIEPHHRNIQGGTARAAVFGISDGLVSNVAIVLAFATAEPRASLVRLAGLAGLIGGAISMAAGEYISMTAQAELLERELEMERVELRRRPETERRELVHIYRSRGIDSETAETLATQLMRDPELALETHAREELGIDPNELGSPVAASVSSFLSFSAGAVVPLIPWFFGGGGAAVLISVLLGAVTALVVGAALARFTGRSVVRSSLRQLLVAAVPAAITCALGAVLGVGVT